MRIAHVINVVDERGSYGGPLRVALNQVDELRRRGHDVTLLGGGRGYPRGQRPDRFAGTDLTLFAARGLVPGGGFAGSCAPGVAAHLVRRATGPRAQRYDVVHVHLGRDLTTLPAAAVLRATRTPYVLQTHGMIDSSQRALAAPLDGLLTRRVLTAAAQVLVLTERDERDVGTVLARRPWRARRLANGVAAADDAADLRLDRRQRRRDASHPGRPEVLYLGRLHERKRPLAFVRIAARAQAGGLAADFVLVGADEGELDAVQHAVAELGPNAPVRYEGPSPMGGSIDRLIAADVLVLPSDADTFPMVLLEAMSVGVPVVCMRSCGLADDVERAGAGLVVPDGDDEAAAAAVAQMLADPQAAAAMGRAGRDLVADRFGIAAVCRELEEVYAAARPGYGAAADPDPSDAADTGTP